jgi:hypothetical protein
MKQAGFKPRTKPMPRGNGKGAGNGNGRGGIAASGSGTRGGTGAQKRSGKSGAARGVPGNAGRQSRKRPTNTGPAAWIRKLVLERDCYRCVICGISIIGLIYSLHHRKNRAMGGTSLPDANSPVNLLTVCGSGTTGCHGKITENRKRKKAVAAGWIVRNNGNTETTTPALIPVRVWWLGMRWPTRDGRWSAMPPETGGHWPPGYNPDDDPPGPCFDCGTPTCPDGAAWEYYMVTNDLWAASGMQHTGGYLCVGCLEGRIGRQLTPEDFPDWPVNLPEYGWKSNRLLTRLGYEEAA